MSHRPFLRLGSYRVAWLSMASMTALAIGAATVGAQESAPCAQAAFRAFDFWIGEWRVTWTTPEGEPAQGRNSIKRVLDGCAIEEHWRGRDGSEGKSLTFFDPVTERWHQTWIDTSAQPLLLDGGFEGRALVLRGKTGRGFTETFHRLTWTPLGDEVEQRWEQSKDQVRWDTVFSGRYQRARR